MVNSDLLQTFLNHCLVEKGLSKNTVNAYRRDLTGFVDFLLNSKVAIEDVDVELVSKFVAELRVKGLSESSIARKVVAIRSWYSFMEKDAGVPNRVMDFLPPKIPKRLPKALTIEEVSSLINSCDDSITGIRNQALIEVLYATGARVSEVVSLNTSDITKSEDSVVTVKVKGKGGKERLVPLGSFAQKALDQYLVRARPVLSKKKNVAALFLNETLGTRLSRQSGWQVVKESADRAKIASEVSPHSLRHSFATHLLDGGADIRVVQELLGHSSVTTTQIYTLVTIDKLRESYIAAHPRSRKA
ncbi:MAG: site-specific tyrosine recombinase XerD [Candidatus Nanopelagicaceae bacterium]|nr:site-specific tyrosine recombinase XerD [Candidatus Nanopelagicaceae bacterium]